MTAPESLITGPFIVPEMLDLDWFHKDQGGPL